MRRIMILGAGIYQVPLIKQAKERGLETVVVSPIGQYPGIVMSDIHLEADTRDIELLVSAAKRYEISGVVTAGTDVSVPAMAAISEAFGFLGPSLIMAKTVISKASFRAFQHQNGLNSPNYAVCTTEKEILDFCVNKKNKCVIKPDDSSGSRGVSILEIGESVRTIIEAFANAKQYSRTRSVCIEDYVPGEEVGGDAFIKGGKYYFFTTTKKHMNGLLVEGHSIPNTISEEATATVQDEILKAVVALGYTDGPINYDVIISEGKATILEMGLRNGGNGIVDIIKYSHGIDLIEWLLDNSIGHLSPKYALKPIMEASSFVFGLENYGRISCLPNLAELRTYVPQLKDIVYARKVGEFVEPMINNANLVGYALLNCGAEDYQNVVSQLRKAIRNGIEIE